MSRDSVATLRVLLSIATLACVGLLVTAIAFGSEDARERWAIGRHVHQHHSHGHPQLPPSLGASPGALPKGGSMLSGGGIISHFESGSGRKDLGGTGGGRMIYTGTEAKEPTLGIDSKGNIFYQGTGVREVDVSNQTLLLGSMPLAVVSRDGGRSWDDIAPETHLETFDPLLYVDKRTDRVFTIDLTWPCLTSSHSDDVGKSWATSEACGLVDHQTLFTGPPVSSPTFGYPNIVYVCAIDGGAGEPFSTMTSCLKSLDGGINWVRTGAPAYTSGDPRHEDGTGGVPGWCEGGTGHGFVDSKGVVYLPRGWCGHPYLAISKDEGATWERIQVADNGMRQAENGIPGNTRIFDHEAAVVVDAKGNIYYFWTGRNRLPYLAISKDGGKSFSKPMMVGPPELKEAWGPTMDIGATGKIALAYVGSTNAPGGQAPTGMGPEYTDAVTWNGYITTSIDALSKKPRFITARVNPRSDPIMRGECGGRCGVQLDFIEVAIGPDGIPWTAMVDGCPAPGHAEVCVDYRGLGFVGTVVGGPRLR